MFDETVYRAVISKTGHVCKGSEKDIQKLSFSVPPQRCPAFLSVDFLA